ncbi:MAG: TIGR01777 family oxidoreductase [Bacteroidia bacterium]
MKVLITGGSGFIGQYLVPALLQGGHEVAVLSRSARKSQTPHLTYLAWNGQEMPLGIGIYDVVINLAGASIAGSRWTEAYKREILDSRIAATRACVQYINRSPSPPQVFISSSAVGYYGFDARGPVAEDAPAGQDFAAQVAQQWEAEAFKARCRTVALRIAVVLGKGGGALDKMLPIYRWYLGGRFGSGKQGFPWIHIDDVVGIIQWLMSNEAVSGPVNVAAPEQVDQAAFSRALARAAGTADPFVIPAFALHLLFGEQAVLFTGGQHIVPRQLQTHGYAFAYPALAPALASVV